MSVTKSKARGRGRKSTAKPGRAALALAVSFSLLRFAARGAEPPAPSPATGESNSFPDLNEVFQGRAFPTSFDREVFFLRRIHESYPAHWPALLMANITLKEYVQAPDKLLRFVEEVGTAMAGKDDLAARTNLAAITSNPAFYASPDAYRPEILRAAAIASIQLGPKGAQTLADAFTQDHYRADAVSLEVLADVVGNSATSDTNLAAALAATAFTFTATNGGSFPRCTREVTRNLLRLPQATVTVKPHLNPKEVLEDPGRFQAVVDGIAAARAVNLRPALSELASAIASKLDALKNYPGPYRDDLLELQARARKAIADLTEISGSGSR